VYPRPAQPLRGSSRRCSGTGQDRGVQAIRPRQETCRDAVCAFEADPAARPAAIARAMRCPVRVHVGSDCAEPSQACQAGRPATTNRPCVRCVTVASVSKVERKPPAQSSGWQRAAFTKWHQSSRAVCTPISATKSGRKWTSGDVCYLVANGGKADMAGEARSVAIDPFRTSEADRCDCPTSSARITAL
jgi:hypothetical protein